MDTDKVIQDLNRRFAVPLPEFYAAGISCRTGRLYFHVKTRLHNLFINN